MKITWNWLGEYVDLVGLTPEQVAADLTHSGIPVEWMQPIAARLDHVVVGQVLAVMAHPNADRLRVCQVDTGGERPLNIVCGAANVAAGLRVPVALIGAVLPGGKIGKSKLRGIESEGMICSAGELGLDVRLLPKDQTVGIYVLPDDAPVGEAIVDYMQLSDMVMELELTPNRSDCLSLRGVAYEVAALYGRTVRLPEAPLRTDVQDALAIGVRIETPRCTGYAAQVVAGLKLKPSPIWMQMRLLAVGTRPINNLVDITNYVMYEWGQPLHAFDYDSIVDRQIVIRQAAQEEPFVTLDGQERALSEQMVVIADPVKAIALAGVMGGQNSEVNNDTKAVVIESALFDPLQTRRTAKALQLRSEASLRFEKGIDPGVTLLALARAAALMQAYGGGAVASSPVITGTTLTSPQIDRTILVRPKRMSIILGYDITEQEMRSVCQRLGFSIEKAGEHLRVNVPARRPDIEIEEDMAEEFARLLGYDRIPVTMMEGVVSPGKLTNGQYMKRILREYLLDLGLHEVWTYSLAAAKAQDKIGVDATHPNDAMGMLLNPLSEDRVGLRTTLLPALLEVARHNVHRGIADVRIFELGTVFQPRQVPMTEQPLERARLAGLLIGHAHELTPHETVREVDFYDVSGLVETLLEKSGMRPPAWTVQRSREPWFHRGQCADLFIGEVRIGFMGKLHANTIRAYDLPDTYYFDLDFGALVAHATERLCVRELPRYPGVERDLALVVDRGLSAGELLETACEAAGEYLEDVSVFDVYMGENIGSEYKSIALRFVFRSTDRTLMEEDVKIAIDRVLDLAQSRHGATLRI